MCSGSMATIGSPLFADALPAFRVGSGERAILTGRGVSCHYLARRCPRCQGLGVGGSSRSKASAGPSTPDVFATRDASFGVWPMNGSGNEPFDLQAGMLA